MKLVIQRVLKAKVTSDGVVTGEIEKGLMVLCGVIEGDTAEDMQWLADKTAKLRIFEDEEGKMNLSVQDIGGSVLVVSNFTLGGDCRKGNRPSFIRAAKEPLSVDLYEGYLNALREKGLPVEAVVFGAYMEIEMTAWGPVTILMDSDDRARPRHGNGG